MTDYRDIINRSRPKSKYPSMTRSERAGQFSPFAALSGFDDAIRERARYTEKKPHLTDQAQAVLDRKLELIERQAGKKRQVEISYFVKDPTKEGGQISTIQGIIKSVDRINGRLIMEGGLSLVVDDIVDLEDSR